MRRHGFITLSLVAILCLAITVVGEEKRSDTDTLPPFTWDHFPPRQASNVSPTTDIAFKITDWFSGPCPSSIFVTIDGDQALSTTYQMDQEGTTFLVVCPNISVFNPGHVLTVTIDAEDWVGNMMAGDDYHLTTCASAPRINCGGYLFTDLSTDGGKLMLDSWKALP